MATLVLRQSKGSPLTNNEVDANFTNLNADIQTRVLITDFNANNILTYLKTVDGSGSGLDADTVDGYNAVAAMPAGPDYSSLVARDAAGNSVFNSITSTGTINGVSATFSGALNVGSISISGGSIPVAVGGTGATNASNARANLGLTIGTNVQAWNTKLDALTTATYAADTIPYFTGATTTSATSLTAYARTLIAASSDSAARTVLGVRVGTDVQPFSAELSAEASLATNGITVRNGSNSRVTRAITGVTGEIEVSNGDGVSGNPALSIGSNIPRLANNNTFAGGSNTFSGTVYAASFQVSSDARLKENVETLNNAVETVSKLRGVSYTKNGVPEIGVIAQEIETVLPKVVGEDPNGYKTVAYGNIVGLLIEAIKEQQETIKELTTRLEKLEN
jgi:hypothetical protein